MKKETYPPINAQHIYNICDRCHLNSLVPKYIPNSPQYVHHPHDNPVITPYNIYVGILEVSLRSLETTASLGERLKLALLEFMLRF